MALTRKALKAMGLTDEQVDSIIEMHTETTDGLKADLNKYKGDAEKLSTVQKELDDLKAKGDDGWKDKHDKVKKELDDLKADQANKETRAAKEKAYRELLKNAGISEKRMDSILKVTDLDGIEMDGESIKDAEKVTESIKNEWSDFIVKTETTGAQTANPPTNGGGTAKTKEEIMSIKDGHARRKAMLENPQLFGLSSETK